MKTTLPFLWALSIMLLFAACQKEIPTKMTGYFYTTDMPNNEDEYRLFVDGVDKGLLPSINLPFDSANPNDSAFRSQSLKLEFMSGSHRFESRLNGKLICASEMDFYFKKRKTGAKIYTPKGASGMKSYDNPQVYLIWLAAEK